MAGKTAPEYSPSNPDTFLRLTAGSRLIRHYCWAGALAKAGRALSSLKHLARAEDTPTFFALDWLANEVTYLWFTCAHDQSMKSIFEALELAKKSGIYIFDSTFYALGIWVGLGRGERKTAEDFFQKMSSAIPPHRTEAGYGVGEGTAIF